MSKDDEISVKEILLRHIDASERRSEDSNSWRNKTDIAFSELCVRMDSHQTMVIEELVALKTDTSRYNDYEAKVKIGWKFGKGLLYLLGAFISVLTFFTSSLWEKVSNYLFRH